MGLKTGRFRGIWFGKAQNVPRLTCLVLLGGPYILRPERRPLPAFSSCILDKCGTLQARGPGRKDLGYESFFLYASLLKYTNTIEMPLARCGRLPKV